MEDFKSMLRHLAGVSQGEESESLTETETNQGQVSHSLISLNVQEQLCFLCYQIRGQEPPDLKGASVNYHTVCYQDTVLMISGLWK